MKRPKIVAPILFLFLLMGSQSCTTNISSQLDVDSQSYWAEYAIHIDPAAHQKFGLLYPATYKFRIPQDLSGLSAQYRYGETEWNTLIEKSSTDFFNGIDAVRFDYAQGYAYVSATFSRTSDNIYLRIINSGGQPIDMLFEEIPKYYDDRKAAVTITLDDWTAYQDALFRTAVDYVASLGLYFSVGVICTNPVYESIQEKIDLLGPYMEIASHSIHHPRDADEYNLYGYDAEVIGSRDELRSHLTWPTHPYIPLYIEPYCYSDSTLEQWITQGDYLVSRRCAYAPLGCEYVAWDSNQGRYLRAFASFDKWGTVGDTDLLLSESNALFDTIIAAGGIYHLKGHPQNGYWYPGSFLSQHLDYLKGRADVWYVPCGQLYLYHFLQERRGSLTISEVPIEPAP